MAHARSYYIDVIHETEIPLQSADPVFSGLWASGIQPAGQPASQRWAPLLLQFWLHQNTFKRAHHNTKHFWIMKNPHYSVALLATSTTLSSAYSPISLSTKSKLPQTPPNELFQFLASPANWPKIVASSSSVDIQQLSSHIPKLLTSNFQPPNYRVCNMDRRYYQHTITPPTHTPHPHTIGLQTLE